MSKRRVDKFVAGMRFVFKLESKQLKHFLVNRPPIPRLRRPNDPSLCRMPQLTDGYTLANLDGWKSLDRLTNFPHGALLLASFRACFNNNTRFRSNVSTLKYPVDMSNGAVNAELGKEKTLYNVRRKASKVRIRS